MPDDPKDNEPDETPIGMGPDGKLLITPPGQTPPPWNPMVVDADGEVTYPEQDDDDLQATYEALAAIEGDDDDD